MGNLNQQEYYNNILNKFNQSISKNEIATIFEPEHVSDSSEVVDKNLENTEFVLPSVSAEIAELFEIFLLNNT